MTTLQSPANATAEQPAPGLESGPQRIQLDVTGMTCGACAARVERKLNKVDGVKASVNYATRVATIDAVADVNATTLCEVVDASGYGATVRSDTPTPIPDTDGAEAKRLFRRLAVALILFIPLADLSIVFAVVPSTRFTGWQWLLLALAVPILTWCAWPFYRVAAKNLRTGNATMETLVTLGVLAATGWSIYSMFFATDTGSPASQGVWAAIWSADSIYLEVATGVTVLVLAGRYFEARARSRAGGALRALAALGAKDVSVLLRDGTEMRIPAGELSEGQRFVVRPGETIGTDGLVIEGSAAVDMSAMTGESKPVDVEPGEPVIGGTTALNGRLIVEAAAVGPDTAFAGMMRLVEEAQTGKATAQRLADRVAGVFVPIVVAIAVITVGAWLLAGGPVDRAVAAGLAVLVIACPCALGLATPIAVMVATGRGAQLGIFLKGYQALDTSRYIDTVVFDKTGTVTEGALSVTQVYSNDDAQLTEERLLALAAAVESASEHAVGSAIVAAVDEAARLEVTDFRAEPGRGVSGTVDGLRVSVGSPRWVSSTVDDADGAVSAATARRRRDAEAKGETVIYVAVDGRPAGLIAVADTVKSSAAPAIAALQAAGMRTVLLTGDNSGAARTVADEVGITDVIAEVLPDGKVDAIRELQESGRSVAMVGDGINDGPALATADLGIAIGRGTDVAIGAADVVLVRDDLRAAPAAMSLARATQRTIRTNLIWAFGYNVAAIPIAAAGVLNPLIAGAAMALSSLFVVSNSLRLQHFGDRR
ncbi:copper-transporting ATPase CopA [Gordonia aichiensis NBRC 108223]|uniref:Copper-transporting ATPase CopA n=1 Tax=Gordonia aichiensis NBRC 108223 TaxID=1220583 RepID=L7KFH2_9ACTN|nr:copper-transporting ATPase CopA [Gordonia aichiensis NBRC 108223]